MSDEHDDEWRADAEQLKLLSAETIKDFVAMFRIVADNKKLPKKERERARALVRLLGEPDRKTPKKD